MVTNRKSPTSIGREATGSVSASASFTGSSGVSIRSFDFSGNFDDSLTPVNNQDKRFCRGALSTKENPMTLREATGWILLVVLVVAVAVGVLRWHLARRRLWRERWGRDAPYRPGDAGKEADDGSDTP